jgi:acylphosphatase
VAEIRVRLIIEGRVQGVWFRDSARREAVRRGVFGWVRNCPGGAVEVLAEGPEDQVRDLVSWCAKGPPASRVTGVREKAEPWKGEFDSFEIIF